MTRSMESYTDVLIVGAGPTGLMAATWLSRCGVKFRIVDKRSTKIYNGQADGLQSRTLEIFDSFGFADRVWKESNHMLEMCMWSPGRTSGLQRSSTVIDTIKGISRYQHATLHQGRIERFFLDSLREHGNNEVERSVLPLSMVIEDSEPEDLSVYPVTIQLKHLAEEDPVPSIKASAIPNGLHRSNLTPDDTDDLLKSDSRNCDPSFIETVKAKYMIGCDGAHSWVRKQLGIKLEGEQTDHIWGVLDIIPITDFPDIRKRCAIHSADSGSMMIIPRENKLVRVYCQIKEIGKGNKVDRATITPEDILDRAQKILAPYKISYKYCDWFTAYQIGQRVASKFSFKDRVFLAGDAVHTHSPKAGQGMNVSMQDTFNLGWKLASVVKGVSYPSILSTYESERLQVAYDLINFDHRFSRLFSSRPARDASDKDGVDLKEFRAAYEKGNIFTSGVAVEYSPSMIVSVQDNVSMPAARTKATVFGHERGLAKMSFARNVKLGMRMPSYQVLNQSDGRPWQFQQLLKSDGRWRLVVFAGDITDPKQANRVKKLGQSLAAPSSFLRRFTPASKPIDSVIEVLTIHSSPRDSVELFDFPEILRPFDGQLGWDYWKIYVDDESYHEGHGNAYEQYGVAHQTGCLVLLRPDQHVSFIGSLEDVDQVELFFSAFMRPATAV